MRSFELGRGSERRRSSEARYQQLIATPSEQEAARRIQKFFRHNYQHYREAEQARGTLLRSRVSRITQGVEGVHSDELVTWKIQLCRFIAHPHSTVEDPREASGMAGELFLLVVLICYSLTYVFTPHVFKDNPLLESWGYNNICVGFDMSPAREVAAVMWTMIVYVTVDYCKMLIHRIWVEKAQHRLKTRKKVTHIAICSAHMLYGLSTMTFMICFLIPPTHSRQMHTRPFLLFIITTWLSCACCLWESALEKDPRAKKHISNGTYLFVFFWGALSIYWVVLAERTYWHHDHHPGEGPLQPWYVSFAVDWTWMVCNTMSSRILPAQVILVGGKLLHPDTLESLQTIFGGHRRKTQRKSVDVWRCCKHRRCPNGPGDLVVPVTERDAFLTPEVDSDIQQLATHFEKMSQEKADEDPKCQSDLRCGLTVTLLKCQLRIDDRVSELAPWHREGLFAEPGVYHGFVRVNVTENGAARLSIRLEVPESMDVLAECETEPTAEGMRQIDFLLAESFEQFFAPTPSILLHLLQFMENPCLGGFLECQLKNILRVQANYQRAIDGLDNSKGLLGKCYFSGLPFKLGSGACKFGLLPQQEDALTPEEMPGGLPGAKMTGNEEEVATKYARALVAKLHAMLPDGRENTDCPLREATLSEFKWDFALQIAKSHACCAIKEGDVAWEHSVCPYVPVGTFTAFPEPAFSGGVEGQAGPALYFSPWNQLEAHRPLGALNEARLHVYRSYRQRRERAGGGKQKDRVCPFLSGRP